MVKIVSYKGYDATLNEWLCEVYADTKEELEQFMEKDCKLSTVSCGSTAYTANGDVGILNSNREWSWL